MIYATPDRSFFSPSFRPMWGGRLNFKRRAQSSPLFFLCIFVSTYPEPELNRQLFVPGLGSNRLVQAALITDIHMRKFAECVIGGRFIHPVSATPWARKMASLPVFLYFTKVLK